jgi:hypothetical protein
MRTNDTAIACSVNGTHTVVRQCKAETSRMKDVARSGKPPGYTWRLWNDPRPYKRTPVPTHPIPRRWVTEALTPAWQRALPFAWEQERASRLGYRLTRIACAQPPSEE